MEDLKAMMEVKKRKRMTSNRDSARRCRMKKQKHLNNLISQVTHLRSKGNQNIITSVDVTTLTQHYLNIEAENSVLAAQVGELSHRLQSLSEMITFLNAKNGVFGAGNSSFFTEAPYDSVWNQHIMADLAVLLDVEIE